MLHAKKWLIGSLGLTGLLINHIIHHADQSFDLGASKGRQCSFDHFRGLGYLHVLNTQFHKNLRRVPCSKLDNPSLI